MARPSFCSYRPFFVLPRINYLILHNLNQYSQQMSLIRTISSGRILIFFGILLLLSGASSCHDPVIKHRVIHNNDGTDMLSNAWFNHRPLTVSDVQAYVDLVAHTQVTTFMICSGSDFPYYRSKYGRVFGDDLNGQLDCGCDTASLTGLKKYYRNFQALEAEGTDMITAALSRAKEKGMEAFITYRMNDLHFADTTGHCPIAYSDFWIQHPQYWLRDTTQGWHSGFALDFSHKEVRDHKLDMITEQLEKYQMIDGYDLDFMRFIVYFKTGEGRENAPLMTDLVQSVKAKVDSISARRGKKILLSVRVPPTLNDCLKKGLDVREWIRLGLVDFVTIGVHWIGDPSLPIARFKKELGNSRTPVYGTIDDGTYRPREFYSHGMYRGMASSILAQGGDGLYLFNYYFGTYNSVYHGKLHLEKGNYVCRVAMPELLNELGSLETLKNRNKIYCLSDGIKQYRIDPVSPLPLFVSPDQKSMATIFIGDNPKETIPQECILFFRLNRSSSCKLFVNGSEVTEEKPEYVGLYDRARGLIDEDREYAFTIPASDLKQGDNQVEFISGSGNFTVKRLEIALKYGDVKTHGYF